MRTREFPTEVVLSISTRRLLCEFAQMHACVEFLMGVPIDSSLFGSGTFAEHIRDIVIKQKPALNNPKVQFCLGRLIQALTKTRSQKVAREHLRAELLKNIYPITGKHQKLVSVGCCL